MTTYEAIAAGFEQRADKIRSMSEGKPPEARAQLLAMADQYRQHAESLRTKFRPSSQLLRRHRA